MTTFAIDLDAIPSVRIPGRVYEHYRRRQGWSIRRAGQILGVNASNALRARDAAHLSMASSKLLYIQLANELTTRAISPYEVMARIARHCIPRKRMKPRMGTAERRRMLRYLEKHREREGGVEVFEVACVVPECSNQAILNNWPDDIPYKGPTGIRGF